MCGYVGDYKDLSYNQSISIIKKSPYGFLGTTNKCSIDVVPMYYAYSCIDSNPVIYMMFNTYGEAMNNMNSNQMMTLTIQQIIDSIDNSIFNSVIVKGKYVNVTDKCEQKQIRELFDKKYFNKPSTLESFIDRKVYYVRMEMFQVTGRAYYKYF